MSTDTTTESVDYFWAVWKRKWFIVLFTLATLIGSYVVGNWLPKTYMVTTKVLISPPKVKSELGGDPMSMDSYNELASSPSLLEKIITTLDMKGESGNKLYVESLQDSITIAGPKNRLHSAKKGMATSGFLSIGVIGGDPKQITDIANTWAEILTEESRNIRSNEVAAIYKETLAHYNSTRAKMKEIENDLKAARLKTNLALLQQELNTKKARLTVHQLKYMNIDMKLKERKISASSQTKLKKLKALNDKLAEKEKTAIAKLIRTKDSDDIKWDALFFLYNKYNATQTENNLLNIVDILASNFKELVAFSSTPLPVSEHRLPTKPRKPSPNDRFFFPSFMTTEKALSFNQQYRHLLNYQHFLTSASVPDKNVNEEMRDLYKLNIRNAKSELTKIENTYITSSATIHELKWELSLQSNLVAQLADKTGEAQIMVSEKTSDVRFVAKAIQPHFPVGPDIEKIIILASLIGFFVSIILCIFKDFVVLTEARVKNRMTDA